MIAAIYARKPTEQVLLLALTTLTLAGCADDYSGSAACTESVGRPSTGDRRITDIEPVKAKGAKRHISGHGGESDMVATSQCGPRQRSDVAQLHLHMLRDA